jgi:hypothetical protein
MAMTHWYFFLLPLVVLAVMSLLRFRGCGFSPSIADQYGEAIRKNNPTAWFRLEEASGPTANNEEGQPSGTYVTANSPLSAGVPSWHSSAVPATSLTFAINDPKLIQYETEDPYDLSVRFQGSFVEVANAAPLQDLTEFTLEALVYADWDLTVQGNYYCVLELAGLLPPAQLKAAGFGLYAGPSDTLNPNTPYSWQAWMGNGNGFQRLEEKPYVPDPGNPDPNPGPNVEQDQVTYLAFTFSQSQGQAFLCLYTNNRDMDYVAYELNLVTYVPVGGGTDSKGLHIGVTAQGPLFLPPPPGVQIPPLYPFIGQMANVVIYNKVLSQDDLRHHATAAFFVNSPG